MKLKTFLFIILHLLVIDGFSQNTKVNPLQIVDPYIGVYGGGNVHPCATLPYSVVSLGPDVTYVQSPSGSGYNSGQKIVGFSHVHLSGTGGGGRYGNFSVMPQTGALNIKNKDAAIINEFASPAYYSCDFKDQPIKADLTLSEKVGIHQYTFSKSDTANILLDVSSTRLTKDKSRCTEANVEILSPTMVKGYAKYEGGWGGINPYTLYFYAEFDQPCVENGVWNNEIISVNKNTAFSNQAIDLYLGAFFKFKLNPKNNKVKFKLAVSYLSTEKAKVYFDEVRGWDFNNLNKDGENKWTNYFSKIKIEGGTAVQQKLFYTSFYRTAMLPRDLTGDNPLWNNEEPHYWDFYTFWDTFRTVNPLLTIIDPQRESNIIRTLLDVYKHRGWMPDAWTGGDYGQVQGGSNSDVVVAEAILKNIKGFDYETAYQAMIKNATVQSPFPSNAGRYSDLYNQYGYIPVVESKEFNKPPCGTSRTLEYSYNDYCIAMVAKKLGKKEDYKKYLEKSDAVFKNLYCDSLKIFWAKDLKGNWLKGYEESYTNAFMKDGKWYGWAGPYYEGSALSYSMATLQNIPKLISLHGGNAPFVTFLDRIFDKNWFESDNEPLMHIPWMYVYAGQTHKTYERIQEVLKSVYKPTKDGWPGNDDAGTTSAWYMWATMGVYPVAGQNIYLLTTPSFKSTEFSLSKGKQFKIIAKGLTDKSTFIQSAKLNGKDFNQAWITHTDIIKGGVLEFTMGEKPTLFGSNNIPPAFDDIN